MDPTVSDRDNRWNLLLIAATELEILPLLKRGRIISDGTTSTGRRIMEMTMVTDKEIRTQTQLIWEHPYRQNIDLNLPWYLLHPFRILLTGVGTVNTAHAVTQAVEEEKPHLMIQIGIGGAFESAGITIGDLAVATSDTDIHVGVESPRYPHDPLPFEPVPGLTDSRNGKYRLNPELCQNTFNALTRNGNLTGNGHLTGNDNPTGNINLTRNEKVITSSHKIVQGDFITVSTLTATPERVNALETAFSPCMESMEGAAAAQVAALYAIPFVQIRAASNRVGDRDKSRWDIPMAVNRVCNALISLLPQLKQNQSVTTPNP